MSAATLWRWTKGLGRALVLVLAGFTQWLPGAVLASAAALTAALWLWAGTEGSLRQTLALAEPLVPELESLAWDDLDATLRDGGRAQQVTWQSNGLTVVVDEPRLHWDFLPLLLGQPLTVELQARAVRVTDQRPGSTEAPVPPDSLALLLALNVDFDIGPISWGSHPKRPATVVSQRVQGRYTHGEDAQGEGQHHLRLQEWVVAQGKYQGEFSVGTEEPMALSAHITGTIKSPQRPAAASHKPAPGWQAQVSAQASGNVYGPQATVALNAQVDSPSPGPRAELAARLQPWQAQPLLSLATQFHRLDLSTFWATLPATQLSGTADAAPLNTPGAANPGPTRWSIAATLTNGTPGEWDAGRLPVASLSLQAEGSTADGRVTHFKANAGSGRIEGQGTWQGSAWEGQLLAQGIRLAELDTRLPAAQLNGTARAKQRPRRAKNTQASTEATLNLVAQALPGGSKNRSNFYLTIKRQASISSDISWNGQRLNLSDLRMTWDGSNLQAEGNFTPSTLAWEGEARLQAPGLRANSEGLFAPDTGQGRLGLTLGDGAAFNQWLATLPASATAWAGALPSAQGQASVQWQGGWRSPALQVNATAQVQQLQAPATADNAAWGAKGLNLALSGSAAKWQASASGRLYHDRLQAQLSTTLQGRATGWAGLGGTPDSAPVAWGVTVSQLTAALGPRQAEPALRVDNAAALVLSGRDGALRLGAGALRLQALDNRNGAAAQPSPGTLAWQDSTWGPDGLASSGQFTGLRLDGWAPALARLGLPELHSGLMAAGIGGDLTLQGQWQVTWSGQANQPPQARLTLERQSGDLQVDEAALPASAEPMPTDTPRSRTLPLGLTQAKAELRTQGEDLSLKWQWDSARAGKVQAQWASRLTPGPHTRMQDWLPQRSAPLTAQIRANMSDIGVWSSLAPPGWRVHGRLGLDATVSGTLGKPDWHGDLQADALELRSVVDGLAFGNGTLRATLGGDRMEITRLSLEGAGGAATGGTLQLTGSALWPATTGTAKSPPPSLTLQATAQRLRVSARADRRLTLSGQATAHLTQGLLTLRGALKADQAQFTLPDETAPALGSDVVVRLNRVAPTATTSNVAMKTDLLVQVDLGPRFELQGQGLQTRLSGGLTVSSPPRTNSFQVLGEVRAVNGTYRAYGQPLRIEDGVLRFSGPYDDPSLDVLALRGKANPTSSSTDDQQVGVRITGSARAPRVALYANPDLPDSEKLAWLVLGRPATGVGAEAAVLQQAALALLTDKNGRGMDASLASALGLDDLSLRGGTTLNSDGTTTQTTAISLGKRLSNKVYVAYEQSLNSAVGAVSLFYEVSRRLTVRAQAGQESALDLIFTVQHD